MKTIQPKIIDLVGGIDVTTQEATDGTIVIFLQKAKTTAPKEKSNVKKLK